jgi:hypothetical protein
MFCMYRKIRCDEKFWKLFDFWMWFGDDKGAVVGPSLTCKCISGRRPSLSSPTRDYSGAIIQPRPIRTTVQKLTEFWHDFVVNTKLDLAFRAFFYNFILLSIKHSCIYADIYACIHVRIHEVHHQLHSAKRKYITKYIQDICIHD